MKLRDIIEGRDAPLYHGTQMIHLLLILKENSLGRGLYWGRPNEPNGVRLTRNFKIARNFANESVYPGGVIELDQNKIAQRYKMVPYRDTDASGNSWSHNEAEEVVVVGKLAPLTNYLTGIYVEHTAIQHILANPEEYSSFYQEYPTRLNSPEEVKQLVIDLARHPLRKDMNNFMSKFGPR